MLRVLSGFCSFVTFLGSRTEFASPLRKHLAWQVEAHRGEWEICPRALALQFFSPIQWAGLCGFKASLWLESPGGQALRPR